MSVIGSYSVPGPSASLTFTEQFSTLDELLIQLPDNTSNLINAQDIRDSVFTLWNRIDAVSVVASMSASASVYYTNTAQVPVAIGGIPVGMSFSGTYSVQQMFDMLLYPYVQPSAALSGGTTKEFGSNPAVTLSWNAYKNSQNLTTINLYKNAAPIYSHLGSPFTTNQSGSFGTTAVQDTTTTFSLEVIDTQPTSVFAYTYVYWDNRRYWGTLPVGHPLVTSSGLTFSHGEITALSNELSSGYVQTRTITTNYDYVVFIWPNNAVDLSTNPPHVKIGGFGNNNWVKTRSNVQFINQWGYSGTNYDVWVFGNTQAPNTFTYEIT